MSQPSTQDPVSWVSKLTFDAVFGTVAALWEFTEYFSQERSAISIGKDVFATILVIVMICRHYPVNGRWIVINILCISFFFWQILESYAIIQRDVELSLKFHALTVGIFVSKLLLDVNSALFSARFV